MNKWLRKVVPDLALAAVVALLLTMVINQLDGIETVRIKSDEQVAATDGLTLDERIDVLDASIRRSTLLHLPALVSAAGILVGFACRNGRWAWLTAIGSVLPALIMGVAFFVDSPAPAVVLVTVYTALAAVMALATTALRRRMLAAKVRSA
jgi:hypothetical protein